MLPVKLKRFNMGEEVVDRTIIWDKKSKETLPLTWSAKYSCDQVAAGQRDADAVGRILRLAAAELFVMARLGRCPWCQKAAWLKDERGSGEGVKSRGKVGRIKLKTLTCDIQALGL